MNTPQKHTLSWMQANLAQVKSRSLSPEECEALDAMLSWARGYDHLRNKPLNLISIGGLFVGMTPENVIVNGADLDAAIHAEIGVSYL